MIISNVAIKKQTTVFVLIGMIVIFGTYSYVSMTPETVPDIDIPYIIVTCGNRGVSPGDMEQTIAIPLEDKLWGLEDLKELRTTCAEGFCTIALEFEVGLDKDTVLQKVRDRVDQAKPDLPDEADDPSVTEININEMPEITISVTGPMSLVALKEMAEEIADRMESIPEILSVEVAGGLEREIQVLVDPYALASYKLPVDLVVARIIRENRNISAGNIEVGDSKYSVRVLGEFDNPAEVGDIVINFVNGKPVYLRDIAEVVDGHKDETTRARIDKKESVTLVVYKRSGADTIAMAKKVKYGIEQARKEVPAGVEFTITMDRSREIMLLKNDLENNIITGFILVVTVLFFSLGLRSSFFAALAIPLSLMISFAVLKALGFTLNMIVLFSLILSLGMLVDNAIVIVENIYRHMQEGKAPVFAAMHGTAEVAWPVIASTATTVFAFVPLVFWPGIMGEFMGYLPKTLIVTLTASLFVALIINPTLCAAFLRVKPKKQKSTPGPILMVYRRLLNYCIDRWFVVMPLMAGSLVAMVIIYYESGLGQELFPQVDPDNAAIDFELAQGTALDTSDRVAKAIEDIVIYDEETGEGYSDIEFAIASVGTRSEQVSFSGSSSSPHIGRVNLDFLDYEDRSRHSLEIVEGLRKKLSSQAGIEILVKRQEMGPPTGMAIEIEISGENYEKIGEIAARVREKIKNVPGLVDISDNYEEGRPEVRVVIDRARAVELGLDTFIIGNMLKACFNGLKVGSYREEEDEYDIYARLPELERKDFNLLERLFISDAKGRQIPLSAVAHFELTGGPGVITRKDQKKLVSVTADVQGVSGEIIKATKEKLKDFEVPAGFTLEVMGEDKDMQENSIFLMKAFVAAIFLIALILISQFNSVMLPVIILNSIALSLVGVLGGLVLTRTPFVVVMTGVGVVSLAGVVVNNSIVLLDYVQKLRYRGQELARKISDCFPKDVICKLLNRAETIEKRIEKSRRRVADFEAELEHTRHFKKNQEPEDTQTIKEQLAEEKKNLSILVADGIDTESEINLKEALLTGGMRRFRPVLLTAITTILGLFPMATGIAFDFRELEWAIGGQSVQWWSPMARAVIFGLAFATILTLIVVPVSYYILERIARYYGNTLAPPKPDTGDGETLGIDV